jgi:hypothetical protein
MKNRKGFFFNFKRLLGRNRARLARTTRIRPAVARPQCQTGLGQCSPQPAKAGPRPVPTCAGCARRAASWPGHALSEHRGAAHGGLSATEPRRGLHHDHPQVMAHWRDRVGRLRSGPRKGVASKRISSAQRWCGGAPTSKVDFLGLGKKH